MCPVFKESEKVKSKSETLYIKNKKQRKEEDKGQRLGKENRELSGVCLETRKLGERSLASPQCVYSNTARVNSFNAALYIYRKVPLI